MGRHAEADSLTFALFFATAMSISALPVIAKTLMDLGLYRTDLGMVVVSAAMVDDLVGWIIFAVVLGMMGAVSGQENHIMLTIGLTLAFAGVMLTFGRWLVHRILPFLQAYTKWPGGVLGFALTLALLGAAFTEWIGIHAIFGSFLVGVIIGDSSHLRESTRITIQHFVSFIFAPVFFASIGLKVNFLANFDASLVVAVLAIACVCKLAGGTLGARWGGMRLRDAWAVGFAMNSRGAMEIILGLLALDAGIIRQRLFVALVVMAIVTSMISGPVMRLILRPAKKRRLQDTLSAKLFLRQLKADSRRAAIHEMTKAACKVTGLDEGAVEVAVWAREKAVSTGIGNGVALPHARINGLAKSLVAVGISESGIDFDAPDDKLANVIFLILTPGDDSEAQLDLASEIAGFFRDSSMLERALRTGNFIDFLALIKRVSAESETNA
jgi:Kef-type K+ transport system membrane component KefB